MLLSGPSCSAVKVSDFIAEDPGFESGLVPKIFLLQNMKENVSNPSVIRVVDYISEGPGFKCRFLPEHFSPLGNVREPLQNLFITTGYL